MHLRTYLDDNSVSIAAFAAQIGVSVQAVHRYLSAERIPQRDVMERIDAATGGKVQPNDFYSGPQAKPAAQAAA